jgi:hypothetical protein
MFPFIRPESPFRGSFAGTARRPDAEASSPSLRALSFALWFVIALSVFEGPMRYALNLARLDTLIFLRDAAIFGALLAFVVARVPTRTVPLAAGVFMLLAAVHGLVAYFNIGSPIAAAYGLKMFAPALCGFLAAEAIYRPGPALLRLVALMWLATVIGATLDKFWVDYPWVALNVELGGIDVTLGRDWQSGSIERVAGLTRSSINLAVALPLLSFILLASVRSRVAHAAVCGITLTVLAWTTQKGAILGFALALLALAISRPNLTVPLKSAIVIAAFLMVFAPTVLIHFDMPRDHGVFSFESLIERIERIWPAAWAWIDRFPPFLGVGLGGIGGSQRFFAPEDFNPADNMFVYLFANFGIASLAYLTAVAAVALNARVHDFRSTPLPWPR